MRIAIPGVVFPDTFADNVAYTLRSLGHEVFTPPETSVPRYSSSISQLARSALRRLLPGRPDPYSTWLLETVRRFKPTMILALTQTISPETLLACKDAGVRLCVAWWGDPPATLPRFGLLSDAWDALFLKDPAGVRKLRILGLNAHLLHEAMNPAWHRPIATTTDSVVAVVGNCYDYRQMLLRKLQRQGFPIRLYGPPPPLWSFPEIRAMHTGRYVAREEKSMVFGQAAASLNTSQLAEGDSLNCRAFEIAGAAGLQLMENRAIIAECFEPGTELLTFDTLDELQALIDQALRYPADLVPIRQAGARRATAEHTYSHRLTRLFTIIS